MQTDLPYLEVSGSNIDLGEAIGSTFKDKIQKRIENIKQKVLYYSDYLDELTPFLEQSKKAFPNLILELEATAASASVKLADLMFLNTHEVYHRSKNLHDLVGIRCTSAVSFNQDGALVGHNEDWIGEEEGDLYILKAQVNGVSFLGLNYCTELAGVSASINEFGLVQCINDLNPKIQIGVPRNFLARAILECKNIEEVLKLIRRAPKASGFNHLLIQNHSVCDVEIAQDTIHIEHIQNSIYAHTNHYLYDTTKLKERTHSPFSDKRLQIATAVLHPNMTEEEMIKLLQKVDLSNFPIQPSLKTIGSVLIIPKKMEMKVWLGPLTDTFHLI